MGAERLTMTILEAAHLLGVSKNSAAKAVDAGEIPSIRIGRRILICRAALIAKLNQASAGAGAA